MGQVNLDFSNVQEFEALPAGDYPVYVEQVELKQSQHSDYPYLNYTLVVSEGEYANRKLFMISSLSPKALWRAKAVFQSLGVYQEQMDLNVDDDTNQLLSPDLVGAVALAIVGQEVYEGRVQNRVQDLVPLDSYNEAPGATPVPATPATPAPRPAVAATPAPARKAVTPSNPASRPAFRIK